MRPSDHEGWLRAHDSGAASVKASAVRAEDLWRCRWFAEPGITRATNECVRGRRMTRVVWVPVPSFVGSSSLPLPRGPGRFALSLLVCSMMRRDSELLVSFLKVRDPEPTEMEATREHVTLSYLRDRGGWSFAIPDVLYHDLWGN